MTSIAVPPRMCLNAKVVICSNHSIFDQRIEPERCKLSIMQFPVFFVFAAGEFGVYLPDHIHVRVLFEDSGVWARVP